MSGFGFSIGDIAAIGNYAWTVYKSCKTAGHEFRSISQDVNMLQTELRELSDEASNPNSLIHRCSKTQRDELRVLMRSCKTDLRDLEKVLAKYNSLKSADPRMRDRMRFNTDKQTEMRVNLSTHAERLNLFLTHLNSGALGRIETTQEMHKNAFGEIKAKLDSIHEDVRAGRKDHKLLSSMDDWGTLERELVDDNITEVDVELNKDKIGEWLKLIREEDEEIRPEEDTAHEKDRYQAKVEDVESDTELDAVKNVSGSRLHGDNDNDSETDSGSEASIASTAIQESHRPSPKIDAEASSSRSSLYPSTQRDSIASERTRELTEDNPRRENDKSAEADDGSQSDFNPFKAIFSETGGRTFQIPTNLPDGSPFKFSDPESVFSEFLKGSDRRDNLGGVRQPKFANDESDVYKPASRDAKDYYDTRSLRPEVSERSSDVDRTASQDIRDYYRPLRPVQPLYRLGTMPSSPPAPRSKERDLPSRHTVRGYEPRYYEEKPLDEACVDDDPHEDVFPKRNLSPSPLPREPPTGMYERQANRIYVPHPRPPPQELDGGKEDGGFHFSNPESIFSEFLRSGGGDSSRASSKGEDTLTQEITTVEKPLPVGLEDLYHGTTKKLKVTRKIYDRETGRMSTEDRVFVVPIKRGTKAKTKIKYAGFGDEIEGGTQDLHFIVEEKPHELFKRDGDDLYHTVTLTIREALCGFKRKIATIDGQLVALDVSGPIQPTRTERFAGLGMPKPLKRDQRGDLVVKFKIKHPQSLTERQRKVLNRVLISIENGKAL